MSGCTTRLKNGRKLAIGNSYDHNKSLLTEVYSHIPGMGTDSAAKAGATAAQATRAMRARAAV